MSDGIGALRKHSAPKMDRPPAYRHEIANFRKNGLERVRLCLEEYNGVDLLNTSVVRDSAGKHDIGRMRGTTRTVSVQVKLLRTMLAALKQAERTAVAEGLLPPDPDENL